MGEKGRQSSRRQSHRDIVPPIAIYIHPLFSQPYASTTHAFRILPSRLPSYTPGGPTPHIDPLPSASFTTAIPLRGLSAAFHLRSLNPSSHHPSPPLRFCHHSAMLSRTRWCGGSRTRESGWWATLGTTSSTKKSVYRTTARGVLLYVVFFFSRVGGLVGIRRARIRNPPDDSRCDRSAACALLC